MLRCKSLFPFQALRHKIGRRFDGRSVFSIPNYVAHERFGTKVRGQLPAELRLAVDAEPMAFRCGLYGPDPLLFLPGGLYLSRLLHGNWREQSAGKMQAFLQAGTDGQRSFAAGYLCHLVLDDACHQRIYALMREQGLSHRLLEVGLDWKILCDGGRDRFPVPVVPEKKRLVGFAAELISPVRPLELRAGLSSMALICGQMNRAGKLYRKKLTGEYRQPVAELDRILEDTVDSAIDTMQVMQAGAFLLPGAVPVGA